MSNFRETLALSFDMMGSYLFGAVKLWLSRANNLLKINTIHFYLPHCRLNFRAAFQQYYPGRASPLFQRLEPELLP